MNDLGGLKVALVAEDLPRPHVAGHLSVNHSFVDYFQKRGAAVDIFIPERGIPRLITLTSSFHNASLTRVRGPGIASGRRWCAPARLSGILRVLTRSLVRSMPAGLFNRTMNFVQAHRNGGADQIIGRFLSPKQLAWIAGEVNRNGYDIVVLDTIFRAPLMDRIVKRPTATVLVTHDVFHRRHSSLRSIGLRVDPANFTATQEIEFLEKADIVVAISTTEADLLRKMVHKSAVVQCSMAITPVPRPAHVKRDIGRCLFIGTACGQNADGLNWLLKTVWPKVLAEEPQAELDVLGTVAKQASFHPARVNLIGFVDNIAPYCHRASIALAPLRAGSGLKIKILDYLAHGLPCVGTPLAFDGFLNAENRPFIQVKEPDEFGAAILQLIRGGRSLNMEARAYSYIEKYSDEVQFAGFSERLSDLLVSKRRN